MNYNDKNASLNYWYYRPQEDWPPRSVEEPCEIRTDGRLNLVCTQTTRTAYQQRKLIELWCEVLPKLKGVRHLWLGSRVPQKLFDAACNVPGLESLYVKWSNIVKLDQLESASSLRHVHIGASTKIESIEPLRTMHALSWLGLESVTQVKSLEPISGLHSLQGLTVDGSMWTTQTIETLDPIGNLINLRYLAITNLRSIDQTLRPLFKLRNLEVFQSATWWDQNELRELQRLNPRLTA